MERQYSESEALRIQAHYVALQIAMKNGDASETIGKMGLPPAYAALAHSLYRGMIEQHGIGVPGEAIVMMGLTMGFALGRDFGQAESLEKLTAGVLAS